MKIQFLGYFLSFIQFIKCFTVTINHEDRSAYRNESNRVKRIAEYTRWRVDPRSTREFVVKVLDDDMPKPTPKIIHALNIHDPLEHSLSAYSSTNRLKSPSLAPDDYTRFVMPTTKPSIATTHSYFEEFALKAQTPLRDESPPSGPEFIGRVGMGAPRVQVAPLAPIGFPHRSSYEPPLTPPMGPKSIQHTFSPKRTSFTDVPTRTTLSSDFFSDFVYDDSIDRESKKLNQDFIQGSTFNSYRTPSMEPLTAANVMRTPSIEPAALARTAYGEEGKENDFYFRRFGVEDENSNRQGSLAETESHIDALNTLSDNSYEMQKSEHRHTTENSNKDYNSNYNIMYYGDDVVSSKKTNLLDEVTSGEEIKVTEDVSNELLKYTEDLKYDEDIKVELPDRTTGPPVSASIPPRTSTIKADLDSSDVYYDESENSTDLEASSDTRRAGEAKSIKRASCDLSSLLRSRYNFPKSLNEINKQLKKWTESSPIVKLIDITNGNLTMMENPIYLMIVDDPSSGQAVTAKHTVMVVAGIGGRDHHAVAAAMEMLAQLVDSTEEHKDLLSKHRFLILPVFNPDGYEYTVGLPHRRQWVKNLRQYWDECKKGKGCENCKTTGLRCTLNPCFGVNLDRNFEYQWISAEELETEHPCGVLFAGERQLSEPETRALANFLHSLTTPLYAFITFKEGDVLGVMYPYSHTKNKRLFDRTYRKNATRAAEAAATVIGRKYVAGQTSEFLPLYAGGVEDWVDGHLGIDRVYSVLLFRPADSLSKRAMASVSVERVGHEAFLAVASLLLPTEAPTSIPAVLAHGDVSVDAAVTVHQESLLLLFLILLFFKFNKSYAS